MTVGQAWTGITATDSPAYTSRRACHCRRWHAEQRGTAPARSGAWLVREWRDTGELKYYLTNYSAGTPLCVLASAFRARWSRERAHQRLKEELVLGHFEGHRWKGLPHHALRTMISFTLLQYRRLLMADHRREVLRVADAGRTECCASATEPGTASARPSGFNSGAAPGTRSAAKFRAGSRRSWRTSAS